MDINKEKKIIQFSDDGEFTKWAVNPTLVLRCTGENNDIYYSDFNFSDAYNQYVSDGYKFQIKDKKSQVYKHQAVTFRTLTKKVQNLKAYYGR